MQDVFLQQRESNLLSNAGHAAEITEQVFMWCFLPQREVNLPSNAGHAAEITEQVFMWCFFLKEKPISQATVVMLLRSQNKCHRIISSLPHTSVPYKNTS